VQQIDESLVSVHVFDHFIMFTFKANHTSQTKYCSEIFQSFV